MALGAVEMGIMKPIEAPRVAPSAGSTGSTCAAWQTATASGTIMFAAAVFDVASAFRVYRNVCAPMTAGFSEARARRLRSAIEIVTLFDADKAGDRARQRASQRFPHARVRHLFPPDGKKDAGEMTRAELRALLSDHLPLRKPTNEQHPHTGA